MTKCRERLRAIPPHLSKFPPISPPLGGVAFPSHPENPNENPDSAWKVILNVCACIKIPCVAKVPIKCCGAWARFSVLPQQPTSCYNYLAHFCSSLHVAGLIHPCYRAKLLNFLHIFFHIIKFGGVSNPSFKSLNFIQYFILKALLTHYWSRSALVLIIPTTTAATATTTILPNCRWPFENLGRKFEPVQVS